MAAERGADRRTDCQHAACHPFADIVVGVAGQRQLNAACVPYAEALTGGAGEVRADRIRRQPLIAVDRRDSARERRADRAVGVANVEEEGLALSRFYKRHRLVVQRFIQLAFVKWRVAAFGAVQRLARHRRGGFQQRREIQVLLLGGEAVQLFQQVGAADQVSQAFHAQAGHQLAGFTRDELKVVGYLEGQAVIVILTQLVVLGCYAGRAVVQVTDTQVFTAQRHHRTGAEAEAFRAEDRRLDNVEAGFQAAVDLQTDLMTQTVGDQRLLGFHQTELPWAACIFHRA